MKRTKRPQSQPSGYSQEMLLRRAIYQSLYNASVMSTRMSYGNTKTFDGLRDIYTALGYPQVGAINFTDYWARYQRQDVARKIIDKPVEASWRRLPEVSGIDEKNDAFKEEWEEFEKKYSIYSVLKRLDKLSRIGHYAVLLLGYNDTDRFDAPLEQGNKELLYIQPYSEENAQIKEVVRDPNDPRFGLPKMYNLKIGSSTATDSNVQSANTHPVHHSRVIHVADGLLESNLMGSPALEVVYNRLIDLDRIVGGSAEMFWQGAFQGLAFKADPDFEMDATVRSSMDDEIQDYIHKFQRYLKVQGVDIQSLAPNVADPKNHVDVQLKMISIATGIPKRILEGSERGELASSQDTEAWDDQMDGRRKDHNEPNILRPLIDKLGEAGALNVPEQGYQIEWPDLSAPSDKELAETGRIRTEAIAKYADSPSAFGVVDHESYLKDILGIPDIVANRILQRVGDDISRILREESEDDRESEL